MSNERNLEHLKKIGYLPRAELEVPDSRSKIQINGTKMPGAVGNRIFALWFTWRKEDNGTIFVAIGPYEGTYLTSTPTQPQHVPYLTHATPGIGAGPVKTRVDNIVKSHASLVQGRIRGLYRIEPLADKICRTTFVAQGTMGGQVPDFAMKWAIKYDARPPIIQLPQHT